MQNTKILPVDPPNRKILITYKKVEKAGIQSDFNLVKSGYNSLEITEDQTLEIKGVTSLEIENLGDEEVIINGLKLLPLPHFDNTKNKEIDGSTGFWDLIDKAVTRNSEIFVLPDGTYSDIILEINFLGQEIEYITTGIIPLGELRNFNFFNQAQVICGGDFVQFSQGTVAEAKEAYLVPITLGCGGSTHIGTVRRLAGDIHVGTPLYSFATPPAIDILFNGNFVADTNISPELYHGIPPATRVVITVVNGIVTAITDFNVINIK